MAAGDGPAKAAGAFRTIGELSRDTGLPPHILRYWETRFPQLRPVTRAGNRRYYRPDDVRLVQRIDALLNRDGYTVRGVQQLLAREGGVIAGGDAPGGDDDDTPKPLADLIAIRDALAGALRTDAR
ncbi:MerR family transcriptional regulator [Sphingomonas sp. EC-HK361]|uniref:MerR family transcriptional regulator n=1 Tax=Sphingomonas sp. EC-HK361 TaxID=2038397 RepID=UPI001258913D|nr:MerR family transcriptional regulator [Sphingomonas sp. EC-HK361]VVT06611.1 MerR family transcriptional regulator [Sphingomonas sp. EC-HK361]